MNLYKLSILVDKYASLKEEAVQNQLEGEDYAENLEKQVVALRAINREAKRLLGI